MDCSLFLTTLALASHLSLGQATSGRLLAWRRSINADISRLRQALDQEITNRKRAVERLEASIFDQVPLGTILPWVNKPSQDSPHTENMPAGYLLCDGSLITEGVWAGE